jgi:hypothetical protein
MLELEPKKENCVKGRLEAHKTVERSFGRILGWSTTAVLISWMGGVETVGGGRPRIDVAMLPYEFTLFGLKQCSSSHKVGQDGVKNKTVAGID